MKRHRGVLNEYYWVKEASLNSLHAMVFQPFDILEKVEQWESKKVSISKSWRSSKVGREMNGQSTEDF